MFFVENGDVDVEAAFKFAHSLRTVRGFTRKSIDLRSDWYDKVVRGLMALLLRRPWRMLIFLLGRK